MNVELMEPGPLTYQVLTDRDDGRDHCVMDSEISAALQGPRHALPRAVCRKSIRIQTDPSKWDLAVCPDCVTGLPEGALCRGAPRRNRVEQAPDEAEDFADQDDEPLTDSPEEALIKIVTGHGDSFVDWLFTQHRHRPHDGRCSDPHCRRPWPCVWAHRALAAHRRLEAQQREDRSCPAT